MKPLMHAFTLLFACLPIMLAGFLVPSAGAQDATEIGGEKIVTLHRVAVSTTKPEFTSVTLAPRSRYGNPPDHSQLSWQGQR